ncbi:serine/threonine-protein kinase [Mycolicibacterium psychrotolerans]|uniref:serine/threonine-protein kinase n=1 Tax=Mycolicibacterium psychrotolerans TaxID=216929 RepID=UPI0021F2679E|nr:serine/threonine-protein kinase [Mycolicibacterium psychrotolerans]
MSSPKIGTRFGPYELQSVIGVGGMGEVYRAYDTARERMVAIKLLRPEMAADPNFQERFRRESRIAARLQEPHVIPVHNFGEIDGVMYIDMRLVEGPSLKQLLRTEGALQPRRAVSIIGQVAAALDAAHANGLVHRDIKPENVLLTPDDFAYLVDFGIAHGGGEATVTSTGLVVGSCAYMAPERFSGDRGGPASDVYSLGCLLYEMLTGRAPFEAADVRQVMSAHMFSAPPPPPQRPARRFSQGQVGLMVATIVLLTAAVVLALVLVFSGGDSGTAPTSRLAAPPPTSSSSSSEATSSEETTTSTTTTTSTASGKPIKGVSGTDSQGFVGHSARCDQGSTPAAAIRTSLSLAVVCKSGDSYYYRGERLSDGASLELQNAQRSGSGFTVSNPSDGTRYDVQPNQLTISSSRSVDPEPALEYGSG